MAQEGVHPSEDNSANFESKIPNDIMKPFIKEELANVEIPTGELLEQKEGEEPLLKTEGGKDRKKSRRKRSRSRSRGRRRKRRKRSKSSDSSSDIDYSHDHRRRGNRRRRHRNLWDVNPEEAEKMGLLTGLPINIGESGDFMHADRAARRIYVGNLPLNVKEQEIKSFFDAVMIAAQGPNRKPGESVLGVFLNLPKRFAFVEFRSAIEATQAMDLDGIKFRGLGLKLGRPANYNASASGIAARQAPKLNISKLGILSAHVPNGPNKLYIGGIPYNLREPQVRELLETYGPLRGLFLSYDPATNLTKGYAFAYYEDESVTDAAIEGLNGLQIGDRMLQVRRHDQSHNSSRHSVLNSITVDRATQATATKSLCLMQMVTDEELADSEEVEDIKNDIANECRNYGKLLEILVPAYENGKRQKGFGKVFVQFSSVKEATECKNALQGRVFAERTVVVSYFDDESFDARMFT